MVLATHNLEEAIYLADKVLFLPKQKGAPAGKSTSNCRGRTIADPPISKRFASRCRPSSAFTRQHSRLKRQDQR